MEFGVPIIYSLGGSNLNKFINLFICVFILIIMSSCSFNSNNSKINQPPDLTPQTEKIPEATETESKVLGDKIEMGTASFKMEIQDIFKINGIGIAATGQIEIGTISANSNIFIVTSDGVVQYQDVVDSLEIPNSNASSASAGDNVGLIFADESIISHVDKGLFIVMK